MKIKTCDFDSCNKILSVKNKSGHCKTHNMVVYNKRQERLRQKPPSVVCNFKDCQIVLGFRNTSGYCRSHRALLTKTTHCKFTEDPKKYMMDYDKIRGTDPNRKRKKRDSWLKTKYGITIEDYDRMLLSQDGKCFLCKKEEVTVQNNGSSEEQLFIKNLAVDHNRETGQVRKLLCFRCNSGLGSFAHDPILLREAANYLEEYEGFS